jgi:predicted acylesterase/phospholipase RssA
MRGLLRMLRSDSLADTLPLARLAAKYVDDKMLADIAAEHKKGRRLLIGTTNLDAQRLVIWDMGAIASSGHPNAGKLFRQIMLASAAIPVMFPPQYIEVEAGAKSMMNCTWTGAQWRRRSPMSTLSDPMK